MKTFFKIFFSLIAAVIVFFVVGFAIEQKQMTDLAEKYPIPAHIFGDYYISLEPLGSDVDPATHLDEFSEPQACIYKKELYKTVEIFKDTFTDIIVPENIIMYSASNHTSVFYSSDGKRYIYAIAVQTCGENIYPIVVNNNQIPVSDFQLVYDEEYDDFDGYAFFVYDTEAEKTTVLKNFSEIERERKKAGGSGWYFLSDYLYSAYPEELDESFFN